MIMILKIFFFITCDYLGNIVEMFSVTFSMVLYSELSSKAAWQPHKVIKSSQLYYLTHSWVGNGGRIRFKLSQFYLRESERK